MKKLLLICFIQISLLNNGFSQEINTKKIDSLISYIEKNNQGIGSIAIAQNGKQFYSRSFGQNDITKNATQNKNIKYQIGSITKMLTATMIYQLVDNNKLSLDEKLAQYFPEIPNADKISIAQLLSHTSGLGDYVYKSKTEKEWLLKPVPQSEIFEVIKNQGILFQPGDSIRYSNSGYYLLARILEKKYKKNYKTILQNKIIKPLHLLNTQSIDIQDSKVSGVTSYKFDQQWSEIKDFYFPNVSGVGDVVSTSEDLNTFINALFSYKLISAPYIEKMKPLVKQRFGSGLMQFPFYGMVLYGHGGDTFGTHSVVFHSEKDGLSVALTLNGMRLPLNNYIDGILSTIYQKAYTFPDFTTYDVDPLTFNQYEGTYGANGFPVKLKIIKEGNDLKGQTSGQSAFVLEPMAKNKFRKTAAKIEIEFKPESDTMIFKQAGREFILNKE